MTEWLARPPFAPRIVAHHLVWFDRGELGRLREAFAAPDEAWARKLRAAMTYAL